MTITWIHSLLDKLITWIYMLSSLYFIFSFSVHLYVPRGMEKNVRVNPLGHDLICLSVSVLLSVCLSL